METRLAGLKVAVDVQHLWKPPPRDRDRGSDFRLANGTHVAEADAASIYAAALSHWLRARGALVLENQPSTGILVGSYPQRNRAALAWGAHAYLACHLNAGGGDYAAFEWMSATRGVDLALALGVELAFQVPEVRAHKSVQLHSAERGAICIEACGTLPAVICEPFFGDTLSHQPLLSAPNLVRVGAALA